MMRGNAFQGFVSIPRRRRSWKVESESMTSKSRLNFRRSSYFHCRWSIAGQTTRMRRMRRRRSSSSRTRPDWIVLPRPTPSARSRLTRGIARAFRTGSKLVGVDLDGRVPDAQQRLVLDALALPQPVQPGPAVGVDERLQRLGAVGPVGIDAGQARSSPGPWPWPRPPRASCSASGKRQSSRYSTSTMWSRPCAVPAVVGFDGPDRRQAVADPHGLADFGDVQCLRACHRVSSLRFPLRQSGRPSR